MPELTAEPDAAKKQVEKVFWVADKEYRALLQATKDETQPERLVAERKLAEKRQECSAAYAEKCLYDKVRIYRHGSVWLYRRLK